MSIKHVKGTQSPGSAALKTFSIAQVALASCTLLTAAAAVASLLDTVDASC
jgi:hypothetical protein